MSLGMFNKDAATVCAGLTTCSTTGDPVTLKLNSLAYTARGADVLGQAIAMLRPILPSIRSSSAHERLHGISTPPGFQLSHEDIALVLMLQQECKALTVSAGRKLTDAQPREGKGSRQLPMVVDESWPVLVKALLEVEELRRCVMHWQPTGSTLSTSAAGE